MSGIWLPVAAITISLFLFIILFTKQNTDNKEVKIYKAMIVINLFFSINALATYIFAKTVGNELVIGIMQKFHLSLLFLLSYLFYLYILYINNLKEKTNTVSIKITNIYTLISIILIILLPVTVINYGEILDVGGLAYDVTIIGIILYFIFVIILNVRYFFKNKKNIKKSIPFILLITLFVLGIILRVYYPEIITETYCVAFVVLVMYFTIENPDIKVIEQLNIAKITAEKANRAKSDFLSSMSHEIRTPLNAIVGFSQILSEENIPESSKDEVKDIITASQNLLEIVNGILDISKIEANKMEIVNTNYDLYSNLETLSKLLLPRIGEKPVELVTHFADDIPAILYGDIGKIKQIITNLLTNSVKYTEKGAINFDVNCINEKDNCTLVISIEDTGRGIKPEKIEGLFTKFNRLEEDRNTTLEGTGLGLAITKSLVEMMGGKIVVQSIYGQGSKFTVYLKQNIVQLHAGTEIREIVQQEENLDFSNSKVLVVDDNKLNLKLVDRLLKKYNIDVTLIESGIETIEIIKNGKKFDLILMDDMMPKMSGTEALMRLKQIENFSIPTVALTANALSGMKEAYLKSGFQDYLAKPIEKDDLNVILKKHLHLSSNHINTNKGNIEYLKQNGIDAESAISILGNIQMYNDSLKEFINTISERISKIKTYSEIGDMANYFRELQALNVDSKYLGFNKLVKMAFENLEHCKANDIGYIKSTYTDIEKEINIILGILKEYM